MSSVIDAQQDLLTRMEHLKGQARQSVLPAAEGAQGGRFEQLFSQALRSVDARQHAATRLTAAVDSGQSDNLMGAMLESQKASVAFSALLQVRNKLTSAFDDVMKTPL